jgi:hypothetical protein
MFKLEPGKSYLWIFPIYGAVFLGGILLCGAFGRFQCGIITMPVFLAILLSSELRSEVALDSRWRATYLKGTWQYRALIAWQTIGLVGLLGMSYVFVTMRPQ